jgi:hypothetical protein
MNGNLFSTKVETTTSTRTQVILYNKCIAFDPVTTTASTSIILYCSILLHSSLNCDRFTVLCANTCQFLKFKVLKITTCFGEYGHHQVLKSSGGNCCYFLFCVCPSVEHVCCAWCVLLPLALLCLFRSRTQRRPRGSTTRVRIRGAHATTENSSSFPH